MLGYIVPQKPELKIREFEIYQGYYCGVCMSIKQRYGNLPRLTLSYDSAFLALMFSATMAGFETIEVQRCIANPLKKRNIVYDETGVDYAADMMLLLAFYKFRDDYVDEKSWKGFAGFKMLKKSMKILSKTRADKCAIVEKHMKELALLENAQCNAIDPAAEPFARIMEEVFNWDKIVEEERVLYKKFGYHLGKWIFLMDAYDDIEEDIQKNQYNPLVNQYGFVPDENESVKGFKERIKGRAELNLQLYLSEMSNAYEGMNIAKNKGVIENILYFGLCRKTEEVLNNINVEEDKKEISKDAKSI